MQFKCAAFILLACVWVAGAEAASESEAPADVTRAIASLEEEFISYTKLVDELEAIDQLDRYATMRHAVVDRFLRVYLPMDVKNRRDDLVAYAIKDLASLMADESARLGAIKEGDAEPIDSPRLVLEEYPRRSGQGLVHDVRWSDGRVERRSVFLFGFGEFSGMRRDVGWLGKVGVNYIQTEAGPHHIRPKRGQWDTDLLDYFRQFMDEARQSGVLVDFLISPHYMPQWALDDNPGWYVHLGGFLRYAVNDPGVRVFMSESIQRMLGTFEGSYNPYTICLANEPVAFRWIDDPHTDKLWQAFLRDHYGSVDAMNAQWGSDYASFERAPTYKSPPSEPFPADPALYDWMRFNDQRWANWLGWLEQQAKSTLDRPTHVKVVDRYFGQYDLMQGVAPDEIFKVGDYAGFDFGLVSYEDADEPWALDPTGLLLSQSIVQSVSGKPMLNTENHLLGGGGGARPVSKGGVRASLWLAALNGLDASVAWAWERQDDDPRAPWPGLWQYRPGPTEEYLRTGLDLMRMMPDVARLADEPPRVALVYSRATLLRSPEAADALHELYTGLLQLGMPIGVTTEEMLESQQLHERMPELKLLLLPSVTHLSDGAVRGLERWLKHGYIDGNTALGIGRQTITMTPYCRTRPARDRAFMRDTAVSYRQIEMPKPDHVVMTLREQLDRHGIHPAAKLVDAKTGKPVAGVLFRSAVGEEGDTLASAINLTRQPIHIRWVDPESGEPMWFHDRLGLVHVDAVLEQTLQPLEVKFGVLKSQ